MQHHSDTIQREQQMPCWLGEAQSKRIPFKHQNMAVMGRWRVMMCQDLPLEAPPGPCTAMMRQLRIAISKACAPRMCRHLAAQQMGVRAMTLTGARPTVSSSLPLHFRYAVGPKSREWH